MYTNAHFYRFWNVVRISWFLHATTFISCLLGLMQLQDSIYIPNLTKQCMLANVQACNMTILPANTTIQLQDSIELPNMVWSGDSFCPSNLRTDASCEYESMQIVCTHCRHLVKYWSMHIVQKLRPVTECMTAHSADRWHIVQACFHPSSFEACI